MNFLANKWLTLITRFVLGGFFIYASYHKIADPPDFAKIIYNYKLVPGEWIHLAAMFLPWLELFAGVAVITGLGLRGGTVLLGGLALVFIVALSYNLARCHPTICGCFSTHAENVSLTDEQKFAKMYREIALDAGIFLIALQVLYSDFRNRRAKASD